MRELNSNEKFKLALERTVPIEDPDYIIGEEDSINNFNEMLDVFKNGYRGIIGTTILGQIGNGKTHFLRYVKKYYDKNGFVCLYIPDMFVSGPLVDAINGIYKSFFNGSGNQGLVKYLNEWHRYKESNRDFSNNFIFERLALCNSESEEKLLLDYFSGKELMPDQNKHLRSKFGLKKKCIGNENDFTSMICSVLEFVQIITGKKVLILLDEVDKVYSAETNKISLSRVGLKILTVYRMLFDSLNSKGIQGAVSIGATPEAWEILSDQAAFERRFKDNKLVLKVPKTFDDCFEFIKNRLNEMQIELNEDEEAELNKLIKNLPEEKRKTWADVISNLKNILNNSPAKNLEDNPEQEILNVLRNAILPLTWNEIKDLSDILTKLYPKGQPTSIFTKLMKLNLIQINNTRPKTYESLSSETYYVEDQDS